MDRKKVALGLAAVLVVAAATAWAWTRWHGPARDDTRLVLQGNVDIRQVSLAFDGAARIVEMNVREGDAVHAGDVLARLDTRATQARLAQAGAQVAVAEEALRRLRAGNRPEEIAQAHARVDEARADAELAQIQWQRLQQVGRDTSGKGVSQADIDSAAARREAAAARLAAARQADRLAVEGARKEDVAQAQGQLGAAQAQQALARRDLDEAQLRAPADAVVRSRLLEPGDMASPARPVYTLALTSPKWVRAYLAETALARVHAGDAAQVTLDGRPGLQVPGRVAFISSVAEFTPKTVETPELRTNLVYEIRVRVDDPQDALRLGMPATVHLKLAPAAAASAP